MFNFACIGTWKLLKIVALIIYLSSLLLNKLSGLIRYLETQQTTSLYSQRNSWSWSQEHRNTGYLLDPVELGFAENTSDVLCAERLHWGNPWAVDSSHLYHRVLMGFYKDKNTVGFFFHLSNFHNFEFYKLSWKDTL